MSTTQLTDQVRKRLSALLAEDRPRRERLLTRLRELRSLEGVPACSVVVHLLAHLDLPEEDAEQVLIELLGHRDHMRDVLGRDPGLRVAAIDYLSNVNPMLRNPTIVELSHLERTERSAMTDDLTGLYNRRYFHGALEIEIHRSRRYATPLSLLMLDLDAFKSVNDLYGHPFGDLVLQLAGQILRRALRESDLPCRIGGEEFAVILTETDRRGAYVVAERVRTTIERHFLEHQVGGRVVAMTVSGGIACYPEHGEQPDQLIERVDQALYQSKTNGRNRVSLYHGERRASARYPIGADQPVRISGHSTPGYGVNLSRGGALLELQSELLPEDPVVLTLVDRHTDGAGRWTIDGRVVRVEPGGARGNRVAVAFDRPLPERCPVRRVSITAFERTAHRDDS
jgi:diguanylate cyclase (GGDEF)-like protein